MKRLLSVLALSFLTLFVSCGDEGTEAKVEQVQHEACEAEMVASINKIKTDLSTFLGLKERFDVKTTYNDSANQAETLRISLDAALVAFEAKYAGVVCKIPVKTSGKKDAEIEADLIVEADKFVEQFRAALK